MSKNILIFGLAALGIYLIYKLASGSRRRPRGGGGGGGGDNSDDDDHNSGGNGRNGDNGGDDGGGDTVNIAIKAIAEILKIAIGAFRYQKM
jgi:hypothetical protein